MQAAPSLVRKIINQAFNQGKLYIVDELVAADVATHMSSWGLSASR